ncbi:hypothetical protein [Microbacterium hominis]|uniref:hypothetical protein n=1 Tax=Microbacterium hominis TaxID=162426 RepID=UPI00077C168B|nr:hypothetical protein [Microbacterium hominis]
MTGDVDIRSGGLVVVDTDTLRHLAATLALFAARLAEAGEVLGRAHASSLAGGLWVASPQGGARAAEDAAAALAHSVRRLAEVYELAEQEALARIRGAGGADGADGLRLAARRLAVAPDVAAEAAHLAEAWSEGRHAEIEGQMRAAAGMLGVYGPLGPSLTLLTGAVRAAGRGTIPADAPPLRPVGATASVVELSRHRAPGAAAAPRSLVEIIDRMPGEDGLDGARVRVEEYRFASGEREFFVYIGGTRAAVDRDEPWDMASNVQLYFGEESSSYEAVERALAAAGAVAGDRLHVVGHSQGAMIGAHLARQGGYDVRTQIGIAGPVQAELPAGVLSLTIRHTDDPVAALAVGGPPGVAGSPQSLVVERTAHPAPAWTDATLVVHGLDAYRDTAGLVDAAPDPRVAAVRDRLAPLAGAVTVTSIVYGARRTSSADDARVRRRSGGL